ncbi:MAG: hypothetical protein ABIK28_16140 [Planctomycetota bacterium]
MKSFTTEMFLFLITILLVFVLAPTAEAQINPVPEGTPLPDYAKSIRLHRSGPCPELFDALTVNTLPNIMLVGYWPPTNEMLRQFSPDPVQNPSGWAGENWEGRGFNVYAFFPEFPGGLGKGEGDFEVDYQDTSDDFWLFSGVVNPVAIVTFGRAYANWDWEIEWRHRNLTTSYWHDDYEIPLIPTPCPPDATAPDMFRRYASLPAEEIASAVNEAEIGVNAFVGNTGNSGAFLCEFIGYHAQWYHDLHAEASDPAQNIAAGHVHVGSLMDVATATQAAEITVRTVTEYLGQSLVPNYCVLYEELGGSITFELNQTPDDADRNYLLLAGMSGTDPGFQLPGNEILPLNWDLFTDIEMMLLNTGYFSTFLGTLDATGSASATMNTMGPLPAGSSGYSMYFAYVLSRKPPYVGWYASDAVEVVIVP